jgi:hypothetical protein
MKRYCLVVAAAVLCMASASAQGPAYGPVAGQYTAGLPMSSCGCGNPCSPSDCDARARFGILPFFRKLAFWNKDCSCAEKPRVLGPFGGLLGGNAAGRALLTGRGCGPVGPGAGSGYYPPTPGGQMPGTLVFPNHPYVRSPRDFFMQDVR